MSKSTQSRLFFGERESLERLWESLLQQGRGQATTLYASLIARGVRAGGTRSGALQTVAAQDTHCWTPSRKLPKTLTSLTSARLEVT